MAFTTKQIRDYLMANPGMTDAQIAADMDRFGVTASQVSAATGVPVSDVMSRYEAATATPAFPAGMFSTPGVVGAPAVAAPVAATTTASQNLTPEQLQQFTSYLTPETLNQIYGGLADPTLPGGIRANLGYEWDSMEAQVAGGPGRATLTGYSGPIGADDMYNAYSPTGEFLGRYQADNDDWKALLPIVLAVGGHFLFGGGLGGAGAAGAAGTTAGSVTPGAWLSAAADSQLANLALGADALAGYTAAGAIPTAVNIGGTLYSAGAPISPIFNPAVDSQIANEAIAAAGGNPLTGYFDPSLTPATVQIGDLTYGAGAPVVTATGAPAPTGGTPTGGGGGTTTTTPGGLPPGVTDTITKVLTNPNTLTNLLGLLGGGALGGGSSGPGSVPTQGVPMNTPEYFNQVQGFLNQYLPGQMPNQAQYLQSWYGTGDTMPSGGGMSPDTSVLQQVGLMPKVPTTPPVSAPPQTPATTEKSVSQTILDYLNTSTTLTDAEIASFMDSAGVTASQMAAATGVPVAEVMERYAAATGRPAFPAGMFS